MTTPLHRLCSFQRLLVKNLFRSVVVSLVWEKEKRIFEAETGTVSKLLTLQERRASCAPSTSLAFECDAKPRVLAGCRLSGHYHRCRSAIITSWHLVICSRGHSSLSDEEAELGEGRAHNVPINYFRCVWYVV